MFADRLSRWLFSSMEIVAATRQRRGVHEGIIFAVGDVMCDVALPHGSKVRAEARLLERLGLAPQSYGLATARRA